MRIDIGEYGKYPCCMWCFFREYDRCIAHNSLVEFPPTLEDVDCDDYCY